MEAIGATMEGEWSCLSGMFTNEEADFMAQLLGNCLNSGSGFGVPLCSNSDVYSSSQGTSSTSGGSSSLFAGASHESYHLSDSNPGLIHNSRSVSIDFYMGDHTNTASYLVEDDECLNDQEMIRNGNVEEKNLLESVGPDHMVTEDHKANVPHVPKKRSLGADNGEKTKRKVRAKKNQKHSPSCSNNEEEGNGGINGPGATSSCCSEDDSNASLNLNGKKRASRGAATDPQSLYARKRRERINERLRILQNLVPNGTKVDISTMLEEAVHYVKFLQLQIKLLSSDDLWMYAPLAYNGMDIGLLDLKLATSR